MDAIKSTVRMESLSANERLEKAGPTGPAAFGRGVGFANGGRES
jgi:hypothetical protein